MKIEKTSIPKGFDVITARSIQEIESIRNIWEKMQKHPNSDIDYFNIVINSIDSIIRPHVILLIKNAQPWALAVGRIENLNFKCDFGYKTIYQKTVRTFTLIYEGILGDSSYETCQILLLQLMDLMNKKEADLIYLSGVKLGSPIHELSIRMPSYFFRDKVIVSNKHWKMNLPSDMVSFYKERSAKHRYWLRRLEKIVQKDYPGCVSIKSFYKEKDLDKLFADTDAIAKTTYHRRLNAGFIPDDMTRKIFEHRMKQSSLRAYILYLKNIPCAYWIGTKYGNTFYLSTTGYVPEFKHYEIGTLLLVKLIEDLTSIKDIKYLDFGFGDAFYKKRFGDQRWDETFIYIYPSSLNGIKMNFIRTITLVMYRITVLALKRAKIFEKVKKKWRNILTKKNKNLQN